MKKILLSIGVLYSSVGFSQSYTGYLNDNYSGVHAVINNPANIVDSRLRTDINLIGLSGYLGNDAAGMNFTKDFGTLVDGLQHFMDNDNDTSLLKKVPHKAFLSNDNNLSSNDDILGPSFMFNITPKHSLAFFTRLRTLFNVNNVDSNEIDGVLKDEKLNELKTKLEDDPTLNNITSILGQINTRTVKLNAKLNAHAWAEFGVSYAAVLLDNNEHFLKGGLSLKYLAGAATFNGEINDLNIKFKQGPTKSIDYSIIVDGSSSYMMSENNYKEIIEKHSVGYGADLGFTYEWRPDYEKHSYKDKDGNKTYFKDTNKYKLRIGLSATDIGNITYNTSENSIYNINNVKLTNDDFMELNSGTIEEQLTQFFKVEKVSTFKTSMPTALHFVADWNFYKKFFLNLDTNFDVSGVGFENFYSLTPRYETKYFSAFLPLSLREYSGFNAGFGLRAGPLYVGSGSVISNLLSDSSKGVDVFVGLKIPVFQSRPGDKDEDGLSDNVDNCPEEFGPEINNGCPWGDKDNDTIKDNLDKCPDVAGPVDNEGCPWGDMDKDGVNDNQDKCPEVAGLAEFSGCPDTDGDGVQDSKDDCPKVKGDKKNKGCPLDSDGDGVLDVDDKCPLVAGFKEENGCPKTIVISKEAKKTIDSYAKSIYFNSAKATFKPGVTEKLDMIVEVMFKYKEAKFSIEGHTDSSGKAASNLRLSQRRAKAVMDYLVRKGVSSTRLKSAGFGEEYPIDTNRTRAGRANNRRVQIKLSK